MTYVRYKPDKRCLVAYRLQLAGTEVDVYAKAYRADSRKLNKARERLRVRGPLGPGGVILDDVAVALASSSPTSTCTARAILGSISATF